MNDAVQVISDLFKQEVANQVEAKVINAANVKIMQQQAALKDKEIEQLKAEIGVLKTEINTMKQQLEAPVEVVEAEIIGEE